MRRSAWFAVPLVLTLGCTLNTDYFSEYRGRNLIGNYPFDTTKWVLEPSAPATDFMTWTSIGSATDTASTTKTNVYRLRILNLMPNGDFKTTFSSSLPATNWSTNAGGTITQVLDPLSPSSATMFPTGTTTLHWDTGSNNAATLTADIVSGMSASAWRTNTTYRMNLDVVNIGSNGVQFPVNLFDDSGKWIDKDIGPFSVATNYPVNAITKPFLNSGGASHWQVQFYGSTASKETYTPNGYLANFRVVPDDVPLYVKATLSSLSSGTLTLLPGSKTGMYSFSVDVLDDPAAGANNVFVAKYLSVRVTGMTKNGTKTIVPTAASRPSGGWTTWTTLTYQFGFDFVNNDAALGSNPALTIELSPCLQGVGNVDAGSIYLANPVLNYNP